MRILVHDYSGHPFQAELSRELSRRGHDVVHSYCAAYASGKGRLVAAPGEALRFDVIGEGQSIAKNTFWRRLRQEFRLGFELVRQAHRVRPDVLLASNTPLPTLLMLALYLRVRGIPWVLWHQDVQASAIRSFAGKLGTPFLAIAGVAELLEKTLSRWAAGVVAISDAIREVHKLWGTGASTTVIPNWAPVHEIVPTPRDNAWAREHGLTDVPVLLYSGTLGLKHNPHLLVEVAKAVRDHGVPAQLVVVNEGPAEQVLREEAERYGVPLLLLPFQPYDRLPEVLGTGDVLLVLLEKDAGTFSVPSKTLSYLCAGRPILGLMPAENAAAALITDVGGCVLAPEDASVPDAAKWIQHVLDERDEAAAIGRASRELAEREFSLEHIADRFEVVLDAARVRGA